KMICFFIFFYVLLIPSTIINALAEDNIKPDTLYGHLKKTDDTSELVTSHIIGSSVKTVSHILSSSPSELAKQVTSYALGKFNGSLSSEA
ncbi:hypothetical protein, partial [Xenorhabdus bovienii]|uniref:hypothetical protein n=1 Tax=Xenorhabdus bovienii TaxID=40576 RepID=UPI0023B23372